MPGPYEYTPSETITGLPPLVTSVMPQGRGRRLKSRTPFYGISQILDAMRSSRSPDPRAVRPGGPVPQQSLQPQGFARPIPGGRPRPEAGITEAAAPGPAPSSVAARAGVPAPPPPRAAPRPAPKKSSTIGDLTKAAVAVDEAKGATPKELESKATSLFGFTPDEKGALLDFGLSLLASDEDNFWQSMGQAGLFTKDRLEGRRAAAAEQELAERRVVATERGTDAQVRQSEAEIADMPRTAALEARELEIKDRNTKAYVRQVDAQISQMGKNLVHDWQNTTEGAVALMKDGSVIPLVDKEGSPVRLAQDEAKLYSSVFNNRLDGLEFQGLDKDSPEAIDLADKAARQALEGYRATQKGSVAPDTEGPTFKAGDFTYMQTGPGKFKLLTGPEEPK